MFTTRKGKRTSMIGAIVIVALLLVVGALWWVFRDLGAKTVTGYFNEAVGVYPGSDVRVLGVRVGTVDAVTPVGTQVRIIFTVDDGINVPANVEAVVVSPSVVSDRYVQLTPAYTGGPKLPDGAVISIANTATPVELDQLYQSLDQLTIALGPNGANNNGALSDLVNVGAENLAGNGQEIGTLLRNLSAATQTLSGSSGDLFGTIDNLAKFTQTLKNNDAQVRQAFNQLASVSQFLSADRDDLAGALHQLAIALGQVQNFVQANRARLKSNVDKLAQITQILVQQRASIAEALDDFPLAADNLTRAFDPNTGTLNGRVDLNELSAAFPPSTQSQSNASLIPLPEVQSVGGGQ